MKNQLTARIALGLWLLCVGSGGALAQPGSSSFDVTEIDGSNGFTVTGTGIAANLGTAMSGCDLNGDGLRDVVLGSEGADTFRGSRSGAVYVIFGAVNGGPTSISPRTLDGTNGFAIYGVDPGERLGVSAEGLGDVNGDGLEDLGLGTSYADAFDGEAYVIFGRTTGFDPVLDLTMLDGTNGFTFRASGQESGIGSAIDAADFNGDGFQDVVIGARGANGGGFEQSGEVYVVFGSDQGFPAVVTPDDLDGTDGVILSGPSAFLRCGSSVSGAADMNGDDFDEIIVGSTDVSGGPGAAFVVFGSANPVSIALGTLDGSNGFAVPGTEDSSLCGVDVTSADLDGDGLAEAIINAPFASTGVDTAGEVYVILGSESAFAATIDPSALAGTEGFVLRGPQGVTGVGRVLAGLGDTNGDGIDDLLVGSPFGEPAGIAYVLYGDADGFPASVQLEDLRGTDGFAIASSDGSVFLGTTVGSAGDLNGDDLADLLIGDPVTGFDVGTAYVLYGSLSCFAGTANVANGPVEPVLFVNNSAGKWLGRTVEAGAGDRVTASVVPPSSGGNGKFVVHANVGRPTTSTTEALPFDVGSTCFPLLLPGASPAGIWNNIGKPLKIGESMDLSGAPIADPDRAPAFLFFLPNGDAGVLPPGTTLTFQGGIADPGSTSVKRFSATNAVVLEIMP